MKSGQVGVGDARSQNGVQQLVPSQAGSKSAPAQNSEGNPLADREKLRDLIERSSGNISQVARELGTTRAQVYRWMKRLGLGPRD